MFGPRKGKWASMKGLIWPRKGLIRPYRYLLHRFQRLRGSPHEIAGGFACGVMASFTPFIGFHFLLGGLSAWCLRVSILASAIGTVVGNPWTFPFIWAGTYALGSKILGQSPSDANKDIDFGCLLANLKNIIYSLGTRIFSGSSTDFNSEDNLGCVLNSLEAFIWPMLAGSLPLGLLASFIFYILLKKLVMRYQARRAQRKHLTSNSISKHDHSKASDS